MSSASESLTEIRTELAALLLRLDEAGEMHAGAYVSMALNLLDREPEEEQRRRADQNRI